MTGAGSFLRPAVLGLTVACVLAIPRGTAGQLQPPEVTDVRFEGNEAFPDDSLATAIATRPTECRSGLFLPLCALGVGFALDRSVLRERDLPRDRARLILWYRQRGFREVQVDTPAVVRQNGNAEVVFPIQEGRPVIADSIRYTGLSESQAEEILSDLPIREGDRLSAIALDATRDSIVSRLANRGYAYAQVFRNALRPADDPHSAVVTFEVVPGPLSTYGDITIEGLDNLNVGTVLRTVQISSGDVYRRNEIEEATSRLYGLRIIRSASVVPDTLSLDRDSVVDVAITIQEGDAYRVRAGGGLNTAECFNLEARWTSRNFLGGGRLLQIRGRTGHLLAAQLQDQLCPQAGQGKYARLTGVASVEFVQPWIFSTRNSFSASLFAERQSLPNIFVRRAVGAQLALSRSISPQTLLTFFYRPELSELDADAVLFCTGFLVCDPDDIRRLRGRNYLSPVGASLVRDRSDDLLNPRRGYRVLLDVEHAATWTYSDFRYDRVVLEASRYVPMGPVVFAARLRGGWVGSGGFEGLLDEPRSVELVHPQKRFYTGGANTVRGFAQSGLGPRVLVARPNILLSPYIIGGGGGCDVTDLDADNVVETPGGDRVPCDPAPGTIFEPRPTGGTRVFEANAELRFPVTSFLEGVVFGDVGQAWGRDQAIHVASLEFTPGLGVRFPSPVGPIRVDLAYRFRGEETLSVVTETIREFADGDPESAKIEVRTGEETRMTLDWVSTGTLVPLVQPIPFGANDKGLQLHLSIGQAF
ncbi:MAG: BamA/TamA family outer membrane protein [Longimicrobiales bacterium]|nr:BamA/TamA family outer membrane protein [Longimicrobiales bacterium]